MNSFEEPMCFHGHYLLFKSAATVEKIKSKNDNMSEL